MPSISALADRVLVADGKFVHFDLTTPCRDCPFRRDVPCHPGVANDLPALIARIDLGVGAHSCHKTDPRTDCESAKSYRGKLQHCAGLMIMLHREGQESEWMLAAQKAGNLDMKKLNMGAPVFRPTEMVRTYYKWLDRKRGKRK